MGLSAAAAVSQRLMQAGRDGATPALIVVNASRADEQRVAATLGTLADVAQTLTGPAILVVGEAMSLADVSEAPVINEILLEAAR
jgi:uroporphyrin-III C-methyltransferase